MVHMLTTFNLAQGVRLQDFRARLGDFSRLMCSKDMLQETGPVARRFRHPIMDTDTDNDREFFFVMSFRDREQCEDAVKYIQQPAPEDSEIHESVYAKVTDPVFSCWDDE